MFYIADQRETIAKSKPDLKQPDIVKLLGEQWRNMSAQEKEPYQQKAEADKARYEKERSTRDAKKLPEKK